MADPSQRSAILQKSDLNAIFINEIFQAAKASPMQPEAEESIVEREASETEGNRAKIFRVYEEYSGRKIGETIRTRRESFDKADLDGRRNQEAEVNREVEDFCTWLKETKRFEPGAAHYSSISLKSLLLGLPVGLQVACLFDIILDKWIQEPSQQ